MVSNIALRRPVMGSCGLGNKAQLLDKFSNNVPCLIEFFNLQKINNIATGFCSSYFMTDELNYMYLEGTQIIKNL